MKKYSNFFFVLCLLLMPVALWASNADQDLKTITIQALSGQQYHIPYDPNKTIAQCKYEIENKTGKAAGQQCLIFSGKQLDDNKTLSRYKANAGDKVFLVMRSKSTQNNDTARQVPIQDSDTEMQRPNSTSRLLSYDTQAVDDDTPRDSLIKITIAKGSQERTIMIESKETLGTLKTKIAQEFDMQEGLVHRFSLKSRGNDSFIPVQYEEHRQQAVLENIGIVDGMKLVMEPRSIIHVVAHNDKLENDSFYLTYDTDQTTKVSELIKFVDGYFNQQWDVKQINEIEIGSFDKDKTVKQLSIVPLGPPRESNTLYTASIVVASVLVPALVFYSGHKFTKTDMFGRFWYDRLGRYKKLTEQRKQVVINQLANLYAWRQENINERAKNDLHGSEAGKKEKEISEEHESYQHQVSEQQKTIDQEFSAKKERILRPFSPEDREKLEKAFDQKQEEDKHEEQEEDKPIEAQEIGLSHS